MESIFNITSVRKSNVQYTKDARDNFLMVHYNPDFKLPQKYKDKYFIYIIRNITNGKLYVGKCQNLFDRSNNYIWFATHLETNDNRPIIRAIRSYGIENFIMYPIEICDTKEIAGYREQFYINSLNTIDRTKGYNVSKTIDIRARRDHNTGYTHSIATRIKKGKPVICINPDTKIIFFAVGMKIFAEYMNTGKDNVKNCARGPWKHRGFYIIYLNDIDRDEILKKAIKKERAQIERFQNYYDLNGRAAHTLLPEYIEMVHFVERFLDNSTKDFLIDSGYTAYILTYETDPSKGIAYKIDENIDSFFE